MESHATPIRTTFWWSPQVSIGNDASVSGSHPCGIGLRSCRLPPRGGIKRTGNNDKKMRPRYLIRFDDICPTMNWDVWRQVEDMLLAAEVKPILAIVPDNQCEALKACEANILFWDEVRAWQARGWTIGLHGYQHLYVTRDAGLLRIKASSEFSGLPRNEQESKIRMALRIFERENVVPEIWIAPAHSFDTETLHALLKAGIRCLSDGFSLHPYHDSDGMLWIPQQLWRFRKMPVGVWTVCLHLNRWTTADIDQFRSDLEKFKPMLTDLYSTVARYRKRRRSASDALFSASYKIVEKGRHYLRKLNSAEISTAC